MFELSRVSYILLNQFFNSDFQSSDRDRKLRSHAVFLRHYLGQRMWHQRHNSARGETRRAIVNERNDCDRDEGGSKEANTEIHHRFDRKQRADFVERSQPIWSAPRGRPQPRVSWRLTGGKPSEASD